MITIGVIIAIVAVLLLTVGACIIVGGVTGLGIILDIGIAIGLIIFLIKIFNR